MTLLEVAQAIDTMDRDVTSWEADFLESVLVRLREGRTLTERQVDKLKQIYEKYFDEAPDVEQESDADFDPESF